MKEHWHKDYVKRLKCGIERKAIHCRKICDEQSGKSENIFRQKDLLVAGWLRDGSGNPIASAPEQ